MWSQKQLRDELRFITEFSSLLDVMQQVAVSQLRRTEETWAKQPSLTEVLVQEFFPLLPTAALQDPLVRGGQRGRLLVVITSDEGMVGPLHTAVIRQALERADATTQWLLIGQRGARFLWDQIPSWRVVPAPPDDEAELTMQHLGHAILVQYIREALRDVWVVAPRFLSTVRQDVVCHQVLPLPIQRPNAVEELTGLVVEPSIGRAVHVLARMWLEHVCVETFWSARRAEYASRTLQVEVSRQELAKRAKGFRLSFFKTLHERINVLVQETSVVQRAVARRSLRRVR